MRAADAVEYVKSIPADEPVFVLRGQDVLAATTVEFWAHGAANLDVKPEKIDGARACAQQMADWPTRKLPD
jgi:hypothetical protein